MARMLRVVVAATLAGVALFGAHPAGAQSIGEHIERFDVRIDVATDGTLHIHETITYDFGIVPRHGIERDLVGRERYDNKYDRRYRITDVQVTADAGTPDQLKTTNEGP